MMHPFATGSSVVTLTRQSSSNGNDNGHISFTDSDGNVITSANVITTDASLVGSHFLTTDDENGEQVLTKIELDTSGDMEVVVKNNKKVGTAQTPEGEKKVCLWPIGGGSTCGKTFTKFDSLKRHLAETHKGVRPFACTLCEKTYGRRDYLQRHLKSHNASYAVNLASASGISAAQVVHAVSAAKQQQQQQQQQQHESKPIIVQVQQTSGGLQVVQQPNPPLQPTVSGLPFLSIGASMISTKPIGSKICRWVQNDGTVCGKAFSKLDSLRRHVNELHKGVRPFGCNLCEKSYGRRDYLDRHLKVHDPDFMKRRAGSMLEWGSHLLMGDGSSDSPVMNEDGTLQPPPKIIKKKRKDIPAEEKKICLWVLEDGTACGKTFTKFDSLKRHVSEAHKGVRPFSCSLCGKNYGRRDYLLRHLKSHNEADVASLSNSPPQSNVGGSRLMGSNNQLIGHVLDTGEGNQSHQLLGGDLGALSIQQTKIINVGNTFTLSSNALNSMQTMRISRKKPDDKKTCRWVLDNGTVCGKTFSKFDSLRRHVQELHKGIRPYVCTMCDKSYGRRDYLDRHVKTHTADNPGGSADSLVGIGDHSESCSVSVSVCGDEDDQGDEDENSSELTSVVTVITTDE